MPARYTNQKKRFSQHFFPPFKSGLQLWLDKNSRKSEQGKLSLQQTWVNNLTPTQYTTITNQFDNKSSRDRWQNNGRLEAEASHFKMDKYGKF